jgi:hypothetical protein
MIRYLRKLKYEINYFFKPPLSIPDNFEEGTWKENSDIYDLFKMMSKNLIQDLNLIDMMIFGELVETNWAIDEDFFNNYKFSNKKLKPAYFNVADVKVPYEASRLQHMQKQNLISSANELQNLIKLLC